MKLGVSAFAWTAKFDNSHLRLIPLVKEMGFDGLEIAMFDPSDLAAAEIRRTFEASDLECTVCAILPPGVNPISSDATTRKKSASHLARCVETTCALGAKVLAGPLYAPIGYLPEHRPTEDEWNWAVEHFQKAGELLDANQITLAIEPVNRSETFLLRTAKEAKQLCEAIAHERIGVTLDTFHGNIEERDIVEAVRLLGPRLRHLHLSENDRSLLGEGHVPFPELLATLQDARYDGYLVIEGFGYSSEEKVGPGYLWAAIDVSPEEIAVKGIQYLHRLQAREATQARLSKHRVDSEWSNH